MSGVCAECGSRQRVTKSGLIYKHGDCYGGGEHPLTNQEVSDFVNTLTFSQHFDNPMENFDNSTVGASSWDGETEFTCIQPKTGYTDEDMHEMLWNLTPKRKKLRVRISEWLHKARGCCDD